MPSSAWKKNTSVELLLTSVESLLPSVEELSPSVCPPLPVMCALLPSVESPLPSFASLLFFFNDTAPTEIYTLSLHDALPICLNSSHTLISYAVFCLRDESVTGVQTDRKSTRLNSNHTLIPYDDFCLNTKRRTLKLTSPAACRPPRHRGGRFSESR